MSATHTTPRHAIDLGEDCVAEAAARGTPAIELRYWTPTDSGLLDVYDEDRTLDQILDELHQHWQEDAISTPGGEVLPPVTYWLVRGGKMLATVSRATWNGEVAVTTDLRDCTISAHRCRYVLDGEGHYVRTEVTRLH